MAKKSKLNLVAARIGGAIGKADRKAHQVVETEEARCANSRTHQ